VRRELAGQRVAGRRAIVEPRGDVMGESQRQREGGDHDAGDEGPAGDLASRLADLRDSIGDPLLHLELQRANASRLTR
jgi:hypothetical protein